MKIGRLVYQTPVGAVMTERGDVSGMPRERERMKFTFYENAPKEPIQACNLCGGRELRLVGMRDRYGLEAPTAECKGCGLKQLSLRMTPAAYKEFYEGGHYRDLLTKYYGKPFTAQSIENGQRIYAKRLAKWLDPDMAPVRGGLLLDLGGSTGVVAEYLAYTYNLDATVVEPSEREAERARGRGLAVAQVPVSEYANGGNHYDLVTMCQTVDHLLDIKGDLERVRGWVAPGGKFFVDFAHGGARKIDHPFDLTPATMAAYLTAAGFKPERMEKVPGRRTVNVLCSV